MSFWLGSKLAFAWALMIFLLLAAGIAVSQADDQGNNLISDSPGNGFIGGNGTESIMTPATMETNQEHPAIWEDRIVWEDRRDFLEDIGEYQADIYFYNLSTGEERRLVATAENEANPDVWGDLVVWQGYDPVDYDYEIFLHNLTDGTTVQLTDDVKNQLRPRIWGDYIVWQDGDDMIDAEITITLHDIALGTERTISGDPLFARRPDIWQDRVVWEDFRNGNDLDIFFYNISSDSELQITTDPNAQMNPVIWGDRIVWEDEREGPAQIFQYEIGSGNETKITTGDYNHRTPVISEDRVAFVNENEDSDISLIEFDPPLEAEISSEGPRQWNPDIWEDRIVWQDQRNGEGDIYLYTLGVSLPPLVPDFTENITQGSPPLTIAFFDATSGQAVGWMWDFGDGDTTTEQNPLHTYSEEGSYTVLLTVHNPWQRAAEQKVDHISVGTEPRARFTQNQTEGPAPLSVGFEDQSSGKPVRWDWDFGDGEKSEEQNPIHSYTVPGTYAVNLTVSNIFGTSSVEGGEVITVIEGAFASCTFPGDGIEVITNGTASTIHLDTTHAGTCVFDQNIDPSEVVLFPHDSDCITKIVFSSPQGNRFAYDGNETITGVLGGALVTSCDIYPFNSSPVPADLLFYNFTLDLPSYSSDSTVHMVAWEGCTPGDFEKFDSIKSAENYAIIEALAATVKCTEENMSDRGPAVLVFAVSSDWVETYGWGDNRTVEITSNPSGATAYLDGKAIGLTPLMVSNLSPGPHSLSLVRDGYTLSTTLMIRDKRDSIHVIRIADDGSGEVLNTTFIGHDPVRNLDIFQAESPNGLSTFGLASLSKSGSIFQLLQLIATKAMGASGGGGGGGPSGGGGGGGGGGTTTTSSTTTSATVAPTPAVTAQPTAAPKQGRASAPETIQPTGIQSEPPGSESDVAGSPAELNQTSSLLGFFTTGTSSIIILKNISIVFVVIFVTIVFYYRWRRKED